ncbi:prolyl oligopeptidase family serine peptidase, partial [Clavibacter michiganensis]|uniref:prolyl oligopeptidase family serine peptidase n=1 Tax=Clavibacter michiganensis TaxID=28447 RepID=UPI00292FAF2E
DQVDALHALAADFPLDLDRVAVRGWSFGGYLAALAALRRPDVFHAAVVGAPVTDLRLYDTHYQERYLGDPGEQPAVSRRNSVIDDAGLVDAAEPHRPMMVIHGLADDNVVVAHSLRLSSALLAAGRAAGARAHRGDGVVGRGDELVVADGGGAVGLVREQERLLGPWLA